MYHGDECDFDRVKRDVGGMIYFVQIYEAQDSEWECSDLCQHMRPQIWRASIHSIWSKGQHCQKFLCHRKVEVEEQIYRRKTDIKLGSDVNHFVGYPES